MTRKQKRFFLLFGVFAVAAAALGLTLTALRTSVTYFYTPSELLALEAAPMRAIRLGGLVEEGSVVHGETANDESAVVSFTVTDGGAATLVSYEGLLPDLFRDGQGVVVQGSLDADGTLIADTVLAKHDENYMPKEVADALKEQGVWQEGEDGY